MFQNIEISIDYKDLFIIKNSLLNEIDSLEKQNFVGELKDEINEYKHLLIKINKYIKQIENF